MNIISQILEGKDNKDSIDKITKKLMGYNEAKDFDSSNSKNYPLTLERNFQHTCAFLESQGVNDPENLTTYQFYSRYYYHLERIKRGRPNKI